MICQNISKSCIEHPLKSPTSSGLIILPYYGTVQVWINFFFDYQDHSGPLWLAYRFLWVRLILSMVLFLHWYRLNELLIIDLLSFNYFSCLYLIFTLIHYFEFVRKFDFMLLNCNWFLHLYQEFCRFSIISRSKSVFLQNQLYIHSWMNSKIAIIKHFYLAHLFHFHLFKWHFCWFIFVTTYFFSFDFHSPIISSIYFLILYLASVYQSCQLWGLNLWIYF